MTHAGEVPFAISGDAVRGVRRRVRAVIPAGDVSFAISSDAVRDMRRLSAP